ncbi:MAG: cell division protein ZapA [Deltaproteobacteria bacterium]|nr:cell division protein ZapA [Deltaproteobacteria bacterium]
MATKVSSTPKTKTGEQLVNVNGHNFTLRTADKEKLLEAASWINKRYDALGKKHPLMKPSELQALLLLEIAFERFDWVSNGKELLKQTNQLIEWIHHKL